MPTRTEPWAEAPWTNDTGLELSHEARIRRSSGRPPRVLVVEDDLELELPIRRVLRQVDPSIEVAWFVDGTRVYWELGRRPFDLVVADVLLEGAITGVKLWRLCRIFRPGLPFVLMSSADVRQCLGDLREEGPPFLAKPFSLDSFRACIEGALVGPRHSRTVLESPEEDEMPSC